MALSQADHVVGTNLNDSTPGLAGVLFFIKNVFISFIHAGMRKVWIWRVDDLCMF
jgi:hypothetical protein